VADLSYLDTEKLLLRLGDLAERVLLVGGQAVNFWASHFDSQATELRRDRPFTSKDIDVMASRQDVSVLAARIDGKARIAGFDDNTASLATVAYVDDRGVRRVLDVMNTVFGINTQEVLRTSVSIRYPVASGEIQFRVMHPVLVMESRASNVVRLPGQYNTSRGLRQADASIICARHFLLEHLAAPGAAKKVRDWNERIFRFRTKTEVGRTLANVNGLDV
jgi:hypothetical protein